MNVGIVVLTLLCFIVGLTIGRYTPRDESVGYLRVDRSDPYDEPYLFLELKVDPSVISKKKKVVLHIKNENFISQK